jgi:hypothetical protein
MGIPGAGLTRDTWVDLRGAEDYDGASAAKEQTRGDISLVETMGALLFREILDCAAAAQDTTRQQERAMRDQMAAL